MTSFFLKSNGAVSEMDKYILKGNAQNPMAKYTLTLNGVIDFVS